MWLYSLRRMTRSIHLLRWAPCPFQPLSYFFFFLEICKLVFGLWSLNAIYMVTHFDEIFQRFFFKSQVIATNKFNIGKCEDYVWVTKDELLEYFPEQAEYLNKMIISWFLFLFCICSFLMNFILQFNMSLPMLGRLQSVKEIFWSWLGFGSPSEARPGSRFCSCFMECNNYF